MSTTASPRLLTTEQASAYLNIPAPTLRDWRSGGGGKGPRYLRLNKADPRTGCVPKGNVIRYPVELLDAWVASLIEGEAPCDTSTTKPVPATQPTRKSRPALAVGGAA